MVIKMEYIAAAAQGTIIASFIACVFSYMVLKPLNKSIEDLRNLIKSMQTDINEIKDRQRENEIQLAKTTESAKSAHHRLDDISKNKSRWED